MSVMTDVLLATEAFVDWINEHGDVPIGYRYEVGTPGRKNVRIVMFCGSRSVHAFVDLTNGDLLKAAGWKAPAKGPRGNLLHNLEGAKARFDWSGHYLYK